MKLLNQFNDKFAVLVTNAVGTMWCAYVFTALACWGGTTVNWHKASEIVQWISQTFLQLVLLSVIMVGQRLLSTQSDAQSQEMHDAVMAELEFARQQRDEMKKLHVELKELLAQVTEQNSAVRKLDS